jgi:hypothetical protein
MSSYSAATNVVSTLISAEMLDINPDVINECEGEFAARARPIDAPILPAAEPQPSIYLTRACVINAQVEVGFGGQTGKHLLVLSFTGFDPTRTSAERGSHRGGLSSSRAWGCQQRLDSERFRSAPRTG